MVEMDESPRRSSNGRTNGQGNGHHARGPGRTTLQDSVVETPIVGPETGEEQQRTRVRTPRLARHTITLSDGHEVGLAVAGRGVPFVIAHGFSAEGILYAQTLSRLVDMRFKVIAIDIAGHGATQGLPTGGADFSSYTELLNRTMTELGIRKAVLAGHSMGGRLVAQLAATHPDRAIAVILLDAIVGDGWDRLVDISRIFPPVLGGLAAALVVDTLSTVPVLRDPKQAIKLGRLVVPTIAGHARRPWRMLGPAVSIMRSRGSRWMLERIAQERIPAYAIHGEHDLVVPACTARSAARRSGGERVVVKRATHSWLLKDPETLPAIVHELMKGRLGTATLKAMLDAGVDPNGASDDDVEAALYAPGARVLALTPTADPVDLPVPHRRPRYRFATVDD
jgi:pimeloyl-ACP methyl ester carboxylesterase